ncbi:hypothetical protein [Leisingera sp.]|uniref:hypothetical protein n=1 Tax=Leisingera sp. TaxID=1879318 RepID=UPI002B27085F|nr:hypothetical protein [Leisingera sp.]
MRQASRCFATFVTEAVIACWVRTVDQNRAFAAWRLDTKDAGTLDRDHNAEGLAKLCVALTKFQVYFPGSLHQISDRVLIAVIGFNLAGIVSPALNFCFDLFKLLGCSAVSLPCP